MTLGSALRWGCPMTERDPLARLDEVDSRAEAATPGPWEVDVNRPFSRDLVGIFALNERGYAVKFDDREQPLRATAEFIAHARQDLPALSKALRAVIEALAGHPECDVHPDDDPVTCGWKAAVIDVRNAIQAALAVNDEGGK